MTRKEMVQMIREYWFKDNHVVCHEQRGEYEEFMDWRQTGTNHYRIIYHTHYNSLIVLGDVGDAIYTWSEPVTLEWISKTDYSYFASKCVASENGRGYESWHSDHARTQLQSLMDSYVEDDPDYWAPRMAKAKEEYEIFNNLSCQFEWSLWLHEHGWDIFEDIGEMGEIGITISSRCIGHLEGLKMAFEMQKENRENWNER